MSPSLFQAHLLARKDSPQTSKDAAKRMVESGALSRQEQLVFGAISDYLYWYSKSDFTPKDIPKAMRYYNYDKAYDICRKRFSGLQMKDKIETIWLGVDKKTGKNIYKRRDGCRVWRLK